MKVLHIITGLNDGGAEGVLYRLCTNDNRYEHVVISLLGMGKYGPMLQKQGILVYCLDLKRGSLTLAALRKLYKILKQERPNVIQTWMYHGDLIGGLVARMAGIKKIYWNIRHSTLEKGKSAQSTIYIAKASAILSRWIPRKIICCARSALKIHAGLGYARDKMLVIGNGYEIDRFRPNKQLGLQIRQEFRLSEEIPVLGMVARFDPQKDHNNLLKALKVVKDSGVSFKCLLVGKRIDTANSDLCQKIKSLELEEQVLLLGQRADIPSIMNAIDLHLLSSSSEAFPNVLAEAMACKTPCISTDVGDAKEIVGDTGWIVSPNDPHQLGQAIIEALDEKKECPSNWMEREKIARDRIVKEFSLNKMLNSYHDVWGN